MKIATFNIQHVKSYLEGVINYPLFIKTISDLNTDICGLNEVRGSGSRRDYHAQAERLAAGVDMHSVFGASVLFEGDSPYGNAILSKKPACEMKVIPIKETVEGAEPRSVLFADYGDIVVLQTHLGLKEPEFYEGVNTVYSLLKAQTKPAVLMGDFNLRPDPPAIQKLISDDDITCLPTYYTFPSDNPDKKIDYIFVNKYVTVKSVCVPELVVSDHRPIVAEIEF